MPHRRRDLVDPEEFERYKVQRRAARR
ncbi:MAG: hypothetical protein JWN27_3511, partial [Candidatus Eremiobacteraeota bacterium]|nr:hypothetical protein [Candidatus Eremiobacteraeota bacterium]